MLDNAEDQGTTLASALFVLAVSLAVPDEPPVNPKLRYFDLPDLTDLQKSLAGHSTCATAGFRPHLSSCSLSQEARVGPRTHALIAPWHQGAALTPCLPLSSRHYFGCRYRLTLC